MRAIASMLICLALCGCVAGNAWRSAAVSSVPTIEVAPERQVVITVRNSPVRTALNAGSTVRGYDATGRYQVSPAALRDAAELARRYGLRQLAAWPIQVLSVHCIVFEVSGDRPLDGVLLQLAADPRVESAQALRSFRTQSGAAYDDPYFDLQESLAAMQVEEAHRWSRGRGVRIAVIDSGVDDTHPDLANRIVLERDLTGLPAAARRLETHGTAVAGVIAADAGNGQGIVGIAPEASVLALRACWQAAPERRNAGSRCNTFTLAQALVLAISERADVINLSLSGPPDPLLQRLLQKALALGKIVVCAVPEGSTEQDAHATFPASMPGVLAVASAEAARTTLASATNDIELLYAPGRNVLTLRPASRYDFEDGSSMAAANVSGVVALLLAEKRNLTTAEIRGLLGRAAPHAQHANVANAGVVNACHALAALTGQASVRTSGGECANVKRMHAVRQ